MPRYRVTFTHQRHRTRFEVLVRSLEAAGASLVGEAILSLKLHASPGQRADWRHTETVEVEDVEGSAPEGRTEKT